jgi:hypothetical protein
MKNRSEDYADISLAVSFNCVHISMFFVISIDASTYELFSWSPQYEQVIYMCVVCMKASEVELVCFFFQIS